MGRFEDMAFGLEEEQRQLSSRLAQLRQEGRERTARFRELMSRKLTNTALLLALERCGLAESGCGKP